MDVDEALVDDVGELARLLGLRDGALDLAAGGVLLGGDHLSVAWRVGGDLAPADPRLLGLLESALDLAATSSWSSAQRSRRSRGRAGRRARRGR